MNSLNLARKWRPKSFDQIVGQQISIRMLLNGLFLNKFFPVYLFAGLRGCGKTTTARVFGAAVNCQNLNKFQKDPNGNKIPCLECDSCKSMLQGNHPDFIEIDAASHTGVDNVRQIIEASSYMPLLGQKKIYLIDEAHMLSKAAFNALLKILEEPPASVLFILATTEVPKIPATVLSRCFQVIFTSIEKTELINHIKSMCAQENVSIEDSAIELIIAETEGSVRDAINLLERVRFSQAVVTTDIILSVLGKISAQELCVLFDCLLEQDPSKVLTQLKAMNFQSLSPQNLWDMLIEFCRALLWIKYGVKELNIGLSQHFAELIRLAQKCSFNRLQAIFQLFWSQEDIFLRTNKKHIFLEMVLLQICEQTNIADLEDLLNLAKNSNNGSGNFNTSPRQRLVENTKTGLATSESNDVQDNFSDKDLLCQEASDQGSSSQVQSGQCMSHASTESVSIITALPSPEWTAFLQKMSDADDQMLNSILVQAKFIKFDENSKKIDIQLSNNSRFFKDKIDETKDQWLVKLQASFNQCIGFNLLDAPVQSKTQPEKHVMPASRPIPPQSTTFRPVDNSIVNVKDKDKWPLANLITNHFPGVVKKSGE
ncbi:MAG: DNA polymerase III subunit gamma/tau [Candidatus Babeliales bacterium]|jgi:DNA polymerase-3 subunit gamma/tau